MCLQVFESISANVKHLVSLEPFVAPEEDDKLPTVILLSGQDAMWVMQAPGLKKGTMCATKVQSY